MLGTNARRAQAGLAHFPDLRFLLRIVEQFHVRRVAFFLQRRHHCARLARRILLSIAAEFPRSKPFPSGKSLNVLRMQPGFLHVADQLVIDSFQADRLVLHDLRHVIARAVNIRITQRREDCAPSDWESDGASLPES